jgi:hypothetical protein
MVQSGARRADRGGGRSRAGDGGPARRGPRGLADDAEWAGLLLGEPTVAGVQSYEVGFVRVRIAAVTLPGRQFEVARELRLRCATALTEAGIAAPAMETPGTTMGNP